MNDLITQARTFFEALNNTQRMGLLAAVAVSVLAIGGVVWWSSQESYDEVVHGDSTQLRKAAETLEEKGIPYRYTSNGNALEVPTAHRGEAMVTAASAGLSGWQDILSTIDMGTSPSVEREYRTKALEAELMITLNSLEAVKGSRVHIVPLDRITFIGRDKQASASVTVDTAAPGALSRGQIKGIAHLVAGAVHGLNVQDVQLLDMDGTLLHPNANALPGSFGGSLEEMRAQREGAFRSDILSAAERILGSRDALFASVSVELDTASTQSHTEEFDPNGAVLVTEQLREEKSKNEGRPAGVPGAQTNLPENATGGGGGSETEKFENTNNYEISKTDTTMTRAPGELKRVSTSVAVNQQVVNKLVEGGMTEDAVRQSLEKVIRTAVGYNATRGDQLVVEFIEFAEPVVVEEGSDTLSTLTYTLEGLMPSLVALLAVVLFFLLVARPIVSKITAISVSKPSDDSEDEESKGPPVVNLTPDELLEKVKYNLNHEMETLDPEELNALVEKFMDSSTTVLRRWMKQAS